MTEFLQSLEKLKDLQIVRFFSQFFTEEKLAPIFGQYKDRVGGGTGTSLAHELLVWAIVLAIGTFVIDQIFYWTSPGQIDQARDSWYAFKTGTASLGSRIKELYHNLRTRTGNREQPRERR